MIGFMETLDVVKNSDHYKLFKLVSGVGKMCGCGVVLGFWFNVGF